MSTISIAEILDQLLNRQDVPLDIVLDRYFSSEYRQRTNGHWDDRLAFEAHARKLREIVASATIEVLDELRADKFYSDRHIVRVVKRDGTKVTQEVYLFGELDSSGRFVRIEEATLMLDGDEADRHIGSVK